MCVEQYVNVWQMESSEPTAQKKKSWKRGVGNTAHRQAGHSEEVTHEPRSELPRVLATDKKSTLADVTSQCVESSERMASVAGTALEEKQHMTKSVLAWVMS